MTAICELTSLLATHVSYVRRGANKKGFFLKKSDGGQEDFTREFAVFINREEGDKKLVYGVVYEPDTPDCQGEFASAETIEKAAHAFLADFRNVDLQHNFIPGSGTVVESYIAPTDFSVGGQEVKKGSWVLVTKASDEIWQAIKDGLITGYSMAGRAARRRLDGGDSQLLKGDKKLKKNEIIELIRQVVSEAIAPVESRLGALETPKSPERDELAQVVKAAVLDAVSPVYERMTSFENARGISRQRGESVSAAEKSVFSGLNI